MTPLPPPPGFNDQHQPSAPDNSLAPLIWLVAVGALLFVGIALAEPRFSQRLVLLMCILIALAWVIRGAFIAWSATTPPHDRLTRPSRSERRRANRNPPQSDPTPAGSAVLPLTIAELAHPMSPAGLSSEGVRQLRFIASERLWDRHRINLYDSAHQEQVQTRLSFGMRAALQLDSTRAFPDSIPPLPVLLDELDSI